MLLIIDKWKHISCQNNKSNMFDSQDGGYNVWIKYRLFQFIALPIFTIHLLVTPETEWLRHTHQGSDDRNQIADYKVD